MAEQAGTGVWRFFAHEDDYPDLDAGACCARLGRILSFPTVSHMDSSLTDWSAFDALQAYLREAFPRVFEAAEVTLVDHSLLLVLAGADPALAPVMLMGHQDVVPVVEGTEGDWVHDPFSGYVDETFVWGRGAVDMKDQVAGELEAVEYALAHGWRLARTLIFAFGQDEENLQSGSAALAAELERRGLAPAFLIDEGDYRIVDAAEYGASGLWLMNADLAEKGYADIVLVARSAGGHSSNPFGGTSLAHLAEAIARIAAESWPCALTPLTRALLAELAGNITEGPLAELGLERAEDVDARADEIARACLGQRNLYPLVTTTCAPDVIEGGSSAGNVMPQDMRAVVNFRLLEGLTVEDVLARCRELTADLPVEVSLDSGSSDPVPPGIVDGPGLAAVRRAAARYFRVPGGAGPVRIVPSTVTGATDARSYAGICSECLRFSAFVVDDDECDRGVHGTNERITRRAYLQGIRFLIRLIEDVCLG